MSAVPYRLNEQHYKRRLHLSSQVLLSDVEILSDFSLEFGSALLMNLALRTSGKVPRV